MEREWAAKNQLTSRLHFPPKQLEGVPGQDCGDRKEAAP